MRVLVFDIDGTLADTSRVDGRCFETALRSVFPDLAPAPDPEAVFATFTEFTDTAILRRICAHRGEPDYPAVEARVYERFVSELHEALETVPDAFVAVPGAQEIFAEATRAGWSCAVATGGWRRSAELKLDAAGIPMEGIPLATSSEEERRVDIIRRAVGEATDGSAVSELVYVGDGVWDVRACRELGIGFVGRANGEEGGDRLRAAGARAVIDDFSRPEGLMDLLADTAALEPLAGG